jgi:hypothetical protein
MNTNSAARAGIDSPSLLAYYRFGPPALAEGCEVPLQKQEVRDLQQRLQTHDHPHSH